MIEIQHSNALSLLGELQDGTVSAIITDPPYGIGYHSNYYKGRNPHAPVADDWDFNPSLFFAEVLRVLRPGGCVFMCTRWDVYPQWVGLLPEGLSLKNVIIWVKDNWSSGDLTGNFGMQHEFLLFLTKGRFQIRGYRWPNVWTFPRIPSKRMLHPTQKPVELMQRAVSICAGKGDLIVDPYCGSGTTGEAARQEDPDIRVLLGDIDPKMVRLSCSRLGLPIPNGLPAEATEPASVCPIFRVVPPEPSLWGVHPEDLAYFLGREDPEESAEDGYLPR